MDGIAVLDAGGQYCHLLARRVRQTHVLSHVLPVNVSASALKGVSGIIISGGPRSVTEANAPKIDKSILSLGVPILGICYGHQLLASLFPGGIVKPSFSREYGVASLRLVKAGLNSIFSNVDTPSLVWMSHGDSVERVPDGFQALASTDECHVAAMSNEKERIFGVQFHPEVSHTEQGQQIIQNFVRRVCRAQDSWNPSSLKTIESIKDDIRATVGSKKILFFVSGGVDSTVAYKLCADAIGEDRLHGVYVDTGFMRKNESDAVMAAYEAAGFKKIEKIDAGDKFLDAVRMCVDPEIKRKRIGAAFLDVETKVMERFSASEWLLGQGTIYPDTIESGGSAGAAHIKTHHNRVPELLERVQAGEVVEPLAQFYKDEIRDIGKELGLPVSVVQKQPFPGPGLAVRYLCSATNEQWKQISGLDDVAREFDLSARALPIRAVGVQGDERTYSYVAVLEGVYKEARVSDASRAITNRIAEVNRVAFWVAGNGQPCEFSVYKTEINIEGLNLLREADAIVREEIENFDVERRIWQCPVVLLPFRRRDSSIGSIAIRPVESHDGMTAQYSRLPIDVQNRIASRLLKLDGVDAVLYDVTNKPPATIEWE